MNISPSLDIHKEHHYTKAAADNEYAPHANIGTITINIILLTTLLQSS